ncbi:MULTISPECIES: histidine phosphatase family protein [unclassified Synechocystis]|uniref:histidine phosphatase family protein n=1 Tax=unclassified Synechocystis TaxID=2640012 RepID=UPI00042510D6|nr:MULTISPECIES: histidine phosphatase family protein [unclassified Synechocystis]AIE73147.1 hypothetical protein D082_06180 [Synechocystis sp. PCC 6714]MCT0254333.1 histidine phosphatase family protein [Synechocystis sp. CS-94]
MEWINRLLLFGVVLWVQSMGVSFSESNSRLIGGLKVDFTQAWAEEMTPGEQANRDFQDQLNKKDLLEELQQGGYVIYIRHAQTEKDYADQVTAEMGNCSTQRALSETGWQQAKAIGQGFEKYGIPYGQVFSSQYCRAWQTADLAFGRYEKNADLNFPKSEDYSPEQIAQMKALLSPFLSQKPAQGTNTIIVGHDDLFEATTGIYPDPQGMAYVIKPLGNDQFSLVANLRSEEWLELGQ